MKDVLREFVAWMEEVYGEGPLGSAFEQQVRPESLRWARVALELSLAAGTEVELFTRSIAPQSLIAGLAFDWASVCINDLYWGNLDDAVFERLTTWLARTKHAHICFCPGPLPTKKGASVGSDGRFVLVC